MNRIQTEYSSWVLRDNSRVERYAFHFLTPNSVLPSLLTPSIHSSSNMSTRDTSFLEPRSTGDIVRLYDIAHRPGFGLHEDFEGSMAWYRKRHYSVAAGMVPYSRVDTAKGNLFPSTYIVDKDGNPVYYESKRAPVRPPLVSAPFKMVLNGLREQPYGNFWTNPTAQQAKSAAKTLQAASFTAVFQVSCVALE